MNPTWTSAWRLTATVIPLAGSAGLAGAQARPAADSVGEGTTKIEGCRRRVQAHRREAGGRRPRLRRVHLGWHEVRRSFPAEALPGQLR
jgi:hypothetical protein